MYTRPEKICKNQPQSHFPTICDLSRQKLETKAPLFLVYFVMSTSGLIAAKKRIELSVKKYGIPTETNATPTDVCKKYLEKRNPQVTPFNN